MNPTIHRSRLPILAFIALATLILSACSATPFTPPPSTTGSICVTPVTSCPMAVALPKGASCFCSGAPGVGTVF
jgi:hypothetical protein